MLAKRIIPCLDVKDNVVVKGVRFADHKVVGDIVELAQRYCAAGADELVFYDITASSAGRVLDYDWITKIARVLDIPFCVAGGIRSFAQARDILAAGADKVSINSPALEQPELITELAEKFGSQCVVVGIDSYAENGDYYVYQYTGDVHKSRSTQRRTLDWVVAAQDLGAGEIVLNCMNQDGVRSGYDLLQLQHVRKKLQIPLIASGGAGAKEHFRDVFRCVNVDGALAASVFHSGQLQIQALKEYLIQQEITCRVGKGV